MQRVISNTVLCICTRNRPQHVQSLLQSFELLSVIPKICLIIDSSDADETEMMILQMQLTSKIQLKFIKSLPGLPHQRNVAIKYIRSQSLLNDDGIVSFLDDDVRVSSNYFEIVDELFSANPTAACVGGFVKGKPDFNQGSFFRRAALLGSKREGAILRSGFATIPKPLYRITESEWLPGLTQNIRMFVFTHQIFDGKIRMYGEDIEFYSRIAPLGRILCSDQLPVKHLSAPQGRDEARDVQCFTDGFRWSMAIKGQGGVTKLAVIYSTVLLVFAEVFLTLTRFDGSHFGKVCGHIDFFRNVILNNEHQQKVDHVGSGPSA